MLVMTRAIWSITAKDLRLELRSKEASSSMLVFSILVMFIFGFAFDPGRHDLAAMAPGMLWVAFSFAGVLGLNRSFAVEKEQDCLHGLMLCPIDRSVIYAAKLLSNLILLLLVETITLFLFIFMFGLEQALGVLPQLALIILLGTLGLGAVGTLFAALANNTRAREVLLPILLFSIVIPVILAAVQATDQVLAGRQGAAYSSWLKILAAFDIIFVAVSWLIFEYVIEE